MENVGYLTPQNVVSPKERRYFPVVLVLSLVVWLLVAISLVGIVYVIAGALMLWFANGLLVARLRSEAVVISPQQAPAIYHAFEEICKRLGLQKIPELYIMEADGALNAFATRHSGRDFVVLFSDIVEAYGESSPQLRFLMGHEIGHIRRKHMFRRILTLPGAFVPLLGPAYHRACEATCDRFGVLAAQDYQASKQALLILSGGKIASQIMNTNSFAKQHPTSRGFFVSWHELSSTYPTLSQRVHHLDALALGKEPKRASRNALAHLFALIFSQAMLIAFVIAYIGGVGFMAYKEALKESKLEESASSPTTEQYQYDGEEEYEYEEEEFSEE